MRYLLMAVMLMLCSFRIPTAEAGSSHRESLRGLPGVAVAIEYIRSHSGADGLRENSIRTAVERVLRSNGIRVLTAQERMKTVSEPSLYVGVSSLKDGPEYSLCIEVNLTQIVSLVSRPDFEMFVATWRSSSVGSVGSNKLKDLISTMIEPKIQAFADDFVAVNQK
ncbi:MAG TPA: hypothetical protein VJ746_17695 [Nitrospira sp.]|nr:hypothetical protein [Nitrospira sp.]